MTDNPNPDDSQRLRVLRAAASCPVQAIIVDQFETSRQAMSKGSAVNDNGRIVIVGASLAGLRAAEALRKEGFRGHLTIIGDEPDEPMTGHRCPSRYSPGG